MIILYIIKTNNAPLRNHVFCCVYNLFTKKRRITLIVAEARTEIDTFPLDIQRNPIKPKKLNAVARKENPNT